MKTRWCLALALLLVALLAVVLPAPAQAAEPWAWCTQSGPDVVVWFHAFGNQVDALAVYLDSVPRGAAVGDLRPAPLFAWVIQAETGPGFVNYAAAVPPGDPPVTRGGEAFRFRAMGDGPVEFRLSYTMPRRSEAAFEGDALGLRMASTGCWWRP